MIAMLAGEWTVLIAGEHTEGRFALIEARVQRGAEPPRHMHSREDELIYVLEGWVTFDRDGERLDGPSGTLMVLPRGREHTFSVESTEARLLIVLSPAGLERCLGEPGQPDVPRAEQQLVEWLVSTAARYGVAITGSGWPP